MNSNLEQVIYVGDSITDAPALKLVKENGGLAVSFNGNIYSVREADVAVISGDTAITSTLAEAFSSQGKEGTLRLINEWKSGFKRSCRIPECQKKTSTAFSGGLLHVEQVTAENMERLSKESSIFRKTVRGEAIGKLG